MIAVAGGKGGSGKTTTTLGLARAIARRNGSESVVAVDADWDLPNLVRLASTTLEGTWSDRTPTVVDAVRSTDSTASLEGSPTVLDAPADPGRHDVREVLPALASQFDSGGETVLVDCPAGASPDAATPLRAADRAVLVTPLRPAALRDTVKTAAMGRALDCPPVGVIATRTGAAPDRLAELLGCPVLGAIPEASPSPLSDERVRSAYREVVDALSSVSEAEDSTYRQSQRRTDNR